MGRKKDVRVLVRIKINQVSATFGSIPRFGVDVSDAGEGINRNR